MNFKKKLWISTSLLAIMSSSIGVSAFEANDVWQARIVEEVLADMVVNEDDELIYTIQYGDTLSVISEALEVDLNVLAEINNIVNIDLIFPDTLLTATYQTTAEENEFVANLTIVTPDGEGFDIDLPETFSEDVAIEEQIIVENHEDVETDEIVVETEANNSVGIVTEVPEWSETPVISEVVESDDVIQEEIIEEEIIEEEIIEENITEEVIPVSEEIIPVDVIDEVEDWLEEEIIVEVPVEDIIEESIDEETIEEIISEEVIEEEIVDEELPVLEEELPIIDEELPVEEELPIIEEEVIVEEPVEEEPVVEEIIPEEPAVEPSTPPYDPTTNPSNSGLSYNAAAFKDEVASVFGVTSFSTYRPGDGGDHGQGLAVDFMVPVGSDLGDAIAQYAISNMGAHNISYVIWEQQIYGSWNQSWSLMEDRGSVTANHYDHVHVSFNP
ncbi:LysM peptidoglycan-binding domain-containing protein [Fundicoccus sp. Sow4_H7]|uniref:LysM peptidoglycan-binding domain-containing protein n=1 Tax=Fundicoccus sp. Sow4_H7 TaxID=3438784 RepID=UPI003F90F5E6